MITSFYVVLAYILILFLLSIFFIKKALNSYEEYSNCSRSLGFFFILFTYLGTWIGGGAIVGLVGRSYEYGASQYWIIGMSCIVELFFALIFINRIRSTEIKSITEFFSIKFPDFGGLIRIPTTAAILIRNVTMIAMQLSALSYLITFVFGINRNLSLIMVLLVLSTYTVLSGLWGIVITDVFQGILQTIGLLVLIGVTVKLTGGFEQIETFYLNNDNLNNLNLFSTNLQWYEIIFYIVAFGLFFLMNDQTNWTRIYASKNNGTAKWGFMIPLVVTLIMLVGIAYLGVFQRVVFDGGESSSVVLFSFLFNHGSKKWMVLVLVALIASIMSSADSFMLASGTIVAEDIIKKFVIKDATDKEMIFFTRIFVIVTAAVAFAFAINIDDIMYLWLTGIGMTSIILIPGYFVGWLQKNRSTLSVLIGMGVGFLYVFAMMLSFIPNEPLYICIGIAINFVICLLPLRTSKYETLGDCKTC